MGQNNNQKLEPIFISIIPNLMGGEGHIIPYHQSVSQAVKKLGWTHLVAVPIQSQAIDLPPDWQPCLQSENLEEECYFWQKLLKIKNAVELGISIAKYLRYTIAEKPNLTILFLERFIHLQLFSLLIALLLIPRKNLSVWLLYRRDAHKDKTKFIYKFFNTLIKKLLKSEKLQLLSDSELLSQSLSDYFQESVAVMPIPHTDIDCDQIGLKQSSEIICWWAGSPRIEKGLQTVQMLVNTPMQATQKICLVAAENSDLTSIPQGVKVKLIDNYLTRNQYDYWLCHCDFILLPYLADAYSERTSGIFTECIIAGKIPLVTANTWMAHELCKYHLEELILDWENSQVVFQKILEISQNNSLKSKLKQMQKRYIKLHNTDSYSEKIQQIFLNSSWV